MSQDQILYTKVVCGIQAVFTQFSEQEIRSDVRGWLQHGWYYALACAITTLKMEAESEGISDEHKGHVYGHIFQIMRDEKAQEILTKRFA